MGRVSPTPHSKLQNECSGYFSFLATRLNPNMEALPTEMSPSHCYSGLICISVVPRTEEA